MASSCYTGHDFVDSGPLATLHWSHGLELQGIEALEVLEAEERLDLVEVLGLEVEHCILLVNSHFA